LVQGLRRVALEHRQAHQRQPPLRRPHGKLFQHLTADSAPAGAFDQVQLAQVQGLSVLAEAAKAQHRLFLDHQPLLAPVPRLIEGFLDPQQVELMVVAQHCPTRQFTGEGQVLFGG